MLLLECYFYDQMHVLLLSSLISDVIFRTSCVPPLSFLTFRHLCRNLALSQDVASLGSESKNTTDNSVFGSSLENYFRFCVKAKKRHEVDVLAEVW